MYERTEEEQAEYETWCREYADWYYNNLMEEEREKWHDFEEQWGWYTCVGGLYGCQDFGLVITINCEVVDA